MGVAQRVRSVNCLTPFLQLRPPPARAKRAASTLSLIERAQRYILPEWLSDRCDCDTLRQQLLSLCSRLDVLLRQPIVCRENGSVRTVVVFGCFAYRFDPVARCVIPGRWRRNGCFEPEEYANRLSMPMATRTWLPWLIEDLGLVEQGSQGSLFANQEQTEYSKGWLVFTANRLLRRDPRFRQFIWEVMPRALQYDPVITSIAFAARPEPIGNSLSPAVYNMVWQHEQVFRQVSRENPRLLSLLSVAIQEHHIPLERDPVRELRELFLAAGLSKAAWRYLIRYGMRYLRMIWEYVPGDSRMDIAIEYLKILEEAGLPPPPTERMLHIIISAIRDLIPDDTAHGWCLIPRDVLGIALRAAPRHDAFAHQVFLEQLASVTWWAARAQPALDKNQRHAGWQWLCREAEAWSSQQLVERRSEGQHWESALSEYQDGDFTVVPLTSAAALFEEAGKMMNCVDDYVEYCLDKGVRLFSIRCANSGARLATASIVAFRDDPSYWFLTEVKGYANSDAGHLWQIAEGIARRYSELTGQTCSR